MQFLIKLVFAMVIITVCSQIGPKLPKLAGLIAVMPLTGLLVLIWLYWDNPNQLEKFTEYAKGALWGIGPSILSFLVLWLSLRHGLTMGIALLLSAAAWLSGAVVHRLLL